jgi:type IV pilus assembly protein PilQ
MSCNRSTMSEAVNLRWPPEYLAARSRRLLRSTAALSVAFVAALFVLGNGEAWAKPLNVISKLAVKEVGDKTVVRLGCSAKPMFSVFKLERPPRLTIDLANSRLRRIASLRDVDSWAVSQIASTQFRTSASTISRVMINFRRQAHYTVRTDGREVVVTVIPHKPRPAKLKLASPALRREAAQARKAAQQAKRDVVAAQKVATAARRDAKQARDAERLARQEATTLDREAKRAKQEAALLLQAISSAKSKMRKLSKQARRAGDAEKQVRELTQRAQRARAEAKRARMVADAARNRLAAMAKATAQAQVEVEKAKALAKQASLAKAQARVALKVAAKEREAAAQARSEVAKARREAAAAKKVAMMMRKQALLARSEAARQRDRASKHAQALVLAKKQLLRHDEQLKKSRKMAQKLRGQIDSARVLANARRLEVQRLSKAVALARKAARRANRGQSKAAQKRHLEAQKRYQRVLGQLAKAKKEVALATHQRSTLAQKLLSAQAARRAAERAKAKAEKNRRRALSERQKAELARVAAEDARRRAEAARHRASAELLRAKRARLAADKARVLAEKQRVIERKKRQLAERAKSEAQRRAIQLAAASARESSSKKSLRVAAERVTQLEQALAQSKARERQQRARIKAAKAMLVQTRTSAQSAQKKRRALAKLLAAQRVRRKALLATLDTLKTSLKSQRIATRKAKQRVARLLALKEAARKRVQNKQGRQRQRALAALRRAEARLRSARLAESNSWQRQKIAATAVRKAMKAEGTAWRRLISFKGQLKEITAKVATMQAALASAKLQLAGSRSMLADVLKAKQKEESARKQAQAARFDEERKWARANSARKIAERKRKQASRQLARVKLALDSARKARQREEKQLASLRLAHDKATQTLVRLRRERRLAQAAERAATQKQKAMISRLDKQESRKQRALAALGSKLKKQRAKLAKLRRRWQKAKVSTNASVRNISFRDRGADRSEVRIWVRGKASHKLFKQGNQHVLAFDGTDLPQLLQRTLDTSAYKGPVRTISSFVTQGSAGSRVYVKVDARKGTRHQLRRKGNQLIWAFYKGARFAAGGKSAGKETRRSLASNGGYRYPAEKVAAGGSRSIQRYKRKRYFGRRIDLDFKDAEIHNILRLLSQVGNVNIVTSDAVAGRVTIRMKNVPWDQAMDVILRAKGLGQVREGNLIRVAPLAVLEKEREAELARIKQLALLQPLETRLIPLSYARAATLLPKLQYTLSARGKLTFDERTNMVIARDVGGNLNLLEKMIRNLDTQTPQVMIEARIIEARTNYSKEVGIQWGGAFSASSATGNSTGLAFPNQIGIGGGIAPGGATSGLQFGQAANPNYVVDFPAAAGTSSGGALGLTLGSISSALNINLRLSAAESKGDVRIVSAPRITTLDNVQASINQGVTIPYSQVSAAGVQTSFQQANLSLSVRPHVTADGSVIMKINVSRNEPDFGNTGAGGQPSILTKTANTEMLVKDGDTAVIGGIYTTRDSRSWVKVPWFAEIPIIGWFFKQRRDASDREEVLVFITPRIINRAQSIGR